MPAPDPLRDPLPGPQTPYIMYLTPIYPRSSPRNGHRALTLLGPLSPGSSLRVRAWLSSPSDPMILDPR